MASPGAYLADTFALLQYLPEWLTPFKREAKQLYDKEVSLYCRLVDDVKRRSETGHPPPCFVSSWLANKDQYNLFDGIVAYTIGDLFAAGSVTTVAAMMSLLFAIVHHPETLKRLQNELDTVVSNRFPSFEDIPNPPVVRAVVRETRRWRPVTTGGFPHLFTKRRCLRRLLPT